MSNGGEAAGQPDNFFLATEGLEKLFQLLRQQDYHLLGPRAERGAILYHSLQHASQLPWGYRDRQQPGSYHLQQGETARAFAWANGPQGLKPLFFAPEEPLWRVERVERALGFNSMLPPPEKLAIIGVRPCDLAALAIHDRHFLQGVSADEHYARRREQSFLVAVNCTHPAATCFCAASGDGPTARSGYDLLLDEIEGGFLLSAGSEMGESLLRALPVVAAKLTQHDEVNAQRAHATQQQRTLPQRELAGQLAKVAQSPHWQQIAERCLACGNCTAVCPTCFCHSEHDLPQIDGAASEHLRRWDSCFSAGHSQLHGIPVRSEVAQRYRQWLSHKFDYWHQQFGRSGCVGCGRCISWCPVGIDITEELPRLCGEVS